MWVSLPHHSGSALLAINKRKILQSAQKHLQKGALDKALKDYQTLLKADPKDANVRLKIGDIFLKQGNSEEAVAAYLKVATRFMDDGFDAKSVALFKQIVRIDPKRLEVYPSLAELYQRLGLNSDAMSALQTAADAHYREGDRDQALDLLRRMAALDPTNTANRMKVADLLRQEKRVEEAVEEFRAVAEELERQGDVEGRIVALDRICELAEDDHESLLELGRARVEAGALLEAVEVGERLVAADGDVAEHHELLAQALEGSGKTDEASAHWRRVAELCRARGDESRARDLMQRYGDLDTISADESDEPVLDQTDELAFGEVGGDGLGLEGQEFTDPGFVSEQGMQLGVPMGDESADDADDAEDAPETRDDADFSLEPLDPSDAGDIELPADPTNPPVEAAADAPGELDADPDQLVAEASVLLRYGKHERAVETLRSVVEAQPKHRAALEKLAEALDATDDADGASEVRSRLAALDEAPSEADAGESAAADGEDLFEEVDIELDAEASQPAAPDAASEPELDLDLDVDAGGEDELDLSGDGGLDLEPPEDLADSAPDLEAASPDGPPADTPVADATVQLDADDDSGVDLEIDLSGDFADPAPVRDLDAMGLDAEDDAAADGDADEAASSDASAPSEITGDADIDFEASSEELDFDLEEELAGEEPEGEAASASDADADLDLDLDVSGDEEDEGERTLLDGAAPAAADASDAAEGSSSTTPQQMVDDLDEAEFYYKQGLMAEAREAYQRIISVAPNHPQALLRLGEMDATSSEDAEAPVIDLDAQAPEAEDLDPKLEADERDASDDLEADADPADLELDEPADDVRSVVEETQVADMHLAEDGAADDFFDDDLDASGLDDAADDASSGFDLDITADLGEDDPIDDEADEPELAAADESELAAADDEEPKAQEAASQSDTVETAEAPAEAEPQAEEPVEQAAASEASEGADEAASEESEGADDRDPNEDSFDLAAELSDDLDEDANESSFSGGASSTEEEGFEQVFAAFKQGVQRELDDGDHEAHYDLGIAYKEMGLFDDAIQEFGQAMQSPDRKLACLHMMGLCALDLGRITDATAHLEQALALPELPPEQQLGLRYDLGRAYAESGDVARARASFEAVLELEPDFGDVAERLQALDELERELESDDDDDEGEGEPDEAFESFDDLLDESDAEPEPVAEAAVEYESFDDLMGDDEDDEPVEAAVEVEASDVAADADADVEVVADPTNPPVGLDADEDDVLEPEAVIEDESAEASADETEPETDPEPGGKRRRRKKISFV